MPWNKGITKNQDPRMMAHSVRMKKNNPMRDKAVRDRVGNLSKGRKLSMITREKISIALKGRRPKNLDSLLAIDRCGDKNPMRIRPRELHWSWKGGITPLVMNIRHCFKYRQWRSDVFTRDDFQCVLCGDRCASGRGKTVYLEVDHYPKPFSAIFKENNITSLDQALACEEFWNINNGRTLCRACHDRNKPRIY